MPMLLHAVDCWGEWVWSLRVARVSGNGRQRWSSYVAVFLVIIIKAVACKNNYSETLLTATSVITARNPGQQFVYKTTPQ